ncbi:MAG: hypothetical protein Phog2KO_02090 [Phototrophicaceae bacterium]
MVHALKEAWRVLRQGGILIDSRPLHANITLESLIGDNSRLLRRYTRKIPDMHDKSADSAIVRVVDEEKFQFIDGTTFEYVKLYDNSAELLAYNASLSNPIVHPDNIVHQIKLVDSDPAMTLRVGNPMLLKTYRRLDSI